MVSTETRAAVRNRGREGGREGERESLSLDTAIHEPISATVPSSHENLPFTVKLFRAGFYADCEARVVPIAKIKEKEGIITRTRSFNKPEGMGSRTQAEELALCRKGHIPEITGKGVDVDEAQVWI